MGRKGQDEAINSSLTRNKRAGAAEIIKNSHCSQPAIPCQKHIQHVSLSQHFINPPHYRAATFLGFYLRQDLIFHEDHTSICLEQSASTSEHQSDGFALCSELGCAPDTFAKNILFPTKSTTEIFFPHFSVLFCLD